MNPTQRPGETPEGNGVSCEPLNKRLFNERDIKFFAALDSDQNCTNLEEWLEVARAHEDLKVRESARESMEYDILRNQFGIIKMSLFIYTDIIDEAMKLAENEADKSYLQRRMDILTKINQIIFSSSRSQSGYEVNHFLDTLIKNDTDKPTEDNED